MFTFSLFLFHDPPALVALPPGFEVQRGFGQQNGVGVVALLTEKSVEVGAQLRDVRAPATAALEVPVVLEPPSTHRVGLKQRNIGDRQLRALL